MSKLRTAATETAALIGLALSLAGVLTAAETLPDLIVPEPDRPECRMMWTDDVRYVRHCLIDGEWRVGE